MKYPPNFPKLEEPNFILAEPVWVQYMVVLTGFVTAFGVAWQVYKAYFINHELAMWKIFVGATFSLFFFIISLHSKMRQVWAGFATDKKGCYFRCNWTLLQNKDFYYFVPWYKIGTAYIGKVSDSDGVSETVIIKVKISDDEWEKKLSNESHLPNWAAFFKVSKDENGYRQIALSNHCQNVQKTLEEIEKIRALSKVEE